ncbi:hypothetical protein J6590_003408 [Homalodisca vitripennis]|nr:hypothetical protein J6590_003408 [Homalodisca vitripennis]
MTSSFLGISTQYGDNDPQRGSGRRNLVGKQRGDVNAKVRQYGTLFVCYREVRVRYNNNANSSTSQGLSSLDLSSPNLKSDVTG